MAVSDLAYIDNAGFHLPDYPAVLDYLQAEYRDIYGQDVYLEPDSQDGQWLSVMALACYECMALAAATYNSFSPYTALADALSRNVKLNGIRRRVATFSTVDVLLVGQVGATITDGVVEDTLSQKWNLPSNVVIPPAGQIIVTATAQEVGALTAVAGTVTTMATPTLGWQSVTNLLAATPGVAVETDAQLRQRQTVSTALASLSVMDGIVGGVANVAGVTRWKGYENDSGVTDSDGIPAHSISLVVEGGISQDIAEVISRRKTPGTGTYGTTAITTFDAQGVPNTINFFRPTLQPIKVALTIKGFTGFTTGYVDLIKQALVDAINALDIGEDVLITKLYVPANLAGTAAGATFNITALQIAKVADALGSIDVPIAFNEAASAVLANMTVTVTP